MSVDSMVIRPIEDADIEAVARIYAYYVDNTVVTFDLEAPGLDTWVEKVGEFRERGHPFLVLEVEGVVAGYAYAGYYRQKPAYRNTLETTIYLGPDQLGKGLGKPLLGALLEACKEAGAREVIGIVADAGTDASIKLHESFGFTLVGTLAGVGDKLGRWVDTTIMQLHLGNGRDENASRISS